MEHVFAKASWIWQGDPNGEDTYVEFVDKFCYSGGKAALHISVDGDYTLFVNGVYAASNQYGDMEHYKIYDTIDLAPFLKAGENRLGILVWHFGTDTQRYKKYAAGLIYELMGEDGMVTCSTEKTLSRQSLTYCNGRKKLITGQLGYGFGYDATYEDGWQTAEVPGFKASVTIQKNCAFFPRPVEKLTQFPYRAGRILRQMDGRYYLLDLGQETVGLLQLTFTSDTEQDIVISYGEDLQNGHVRRHIHSRDFSVDYRARRGENRFGNYMLRLSARYLEIECEAPIKLETAGLVPQNYAVADTGYRPEEPLDRDIYQICVNALKLCMMEHYVDTPWREQCLYALDSRNQMLCGYYAFEGGNFPYVRSNLMLLGQAMRPDGLLPICAPCGADLTIPSFSLYFVIAMKEYLQHSGDTAFAADRFDSMKTILQTFTKHIKDDLVYTIAGKAYWNFFDWSPHAEGQLGTDESGYASILASSVLIVALDAFGYVCEKLGRADPFCGLADRLRRGAYARFYDADSGMCRVDEVQTEATELANCLAVCAGIVTGAQAKRICDAVAADALTPCSLSMRTFKYDALVMTDRNAYRDYILREIRRDYGRMVAAGSTATWETAGGATDFNNAGSLCHGWSAVPIYYYHKLLEEKD